MRRVFILTVASLGSFALAVEPTTVPATQPAGEAVTRVLTDVPAAERPLVQIALLLDTSSSMDGLINQARTQLWTIVNEVSRAKRNGQTPRLQVALIEYGNDNLSVGEGYIRTVQTFTDDLDVVSEKLFALTTNGGSEFCGQAIQQATTTLSWSADPHVYKTIFIAGNEPFGQGNVDYRTSIASAIGRGIVVNTVHCGDRGTGVGSGWGEGAKLGEGYFSNIDQNRTTPVIRCPQDELIEKLSIEINITYVPYGTRGRESQQRQSAQDENAMANAPAGSAVQRAASKAGANYDNSVWDLVDAVNNGTVDLATAKDEDLPEAMKGMNLEQRKAYIETQTKHRGELREQINKLMAERQQYLAEHKPDAEAGDATLDAAVVESVRDQLKAREYDVAQ